MKSRTGYKPARVVITGGGTGGHVFPAIAIANALRPYIGGENILFVGALGKMEMEKVPEAGYRIKGLPVRGIQGIVRLENFILPFRLMAALSMAFGVIRKFRPDVVVGVGGFASAPALYVARILRIPYVIQEQNSVPGKVNRWFGRRASLICAAFPGMERYFPGSRVIITGNPVRDTIQSGCALRDEACAAYGLDPEKQVLLVVGGSQGAGSLNRAMPAALPAFVKAGIQVIWQTGGPSFADAERIITENNYSGIRVYPFIRSMEQAYGAADLVVSRAGALAIAEITISGLPSVLVPFPFAAEDHQTKNAQSVAAHGAAVIIRDSEVKTKLTETVLKLISDRDNLHEMGQKASDLSFRDADFRIAKLIREVSAGRIARHLKAVAAKKNVSKVYFLGIGGIGMSSLARWFMLNGREVHGYDRIPSPLTSRLEEEGVKIHYVDRPDMIPPDTGLVVITPAIPATLDERRAVLKLGVPVLKRAELLGMISCNIRTIAVAGTHGKTSTSALVVHLLKAAGIPVTGFIGGITKNYNTNFIFTPNSKFMVVEADEFDRSFLHLSPDFSVITSADADHLDIYGTHDRMKEAFIAFGRLNGMQPLLTGSIVDLDFGKPVIHYSACNSDARYRAENIRDEGLKARFDLILGDVVIADVTLGVPGHHNVENAVAASAAALWAGAEPDAVRRGLEGYIGVTRRFDIRINHEKIIYIDDYAHHPRELEACIGAVRKLCPGKVITGIFQPHLFSRTRDFAEGFVKSLEMLDRIILLEIYPAREEPMPGINSSMLLNMISHPDKRLVDIDDIPALLSEIKPEVLLTMGAGDIDRLVPVIEKLFKQEVKE